MFNTTTLAECVSEYRVVKRKLILSSKVLCIRGLYPYCIGNKRINTSQLLLTKCICLKFLLASVTTFVN